MLINIKLTSSAEHAAFNEAIRSSGLEITNTFDDNQKYLIKQALDLYRQKMDLNLKACLQKGSSALLTQYFEKKINITRQLINQI